MTSTLSKEQIEECKAAFDSIDVDRNGRLTASEIGRVYEKLGESIPGYKIREMIMPYDANSDGVLSFEEFIKCYEEELVPKMAHLSGGETGSGEGVTLSKASEAEVLAFTDWINSALKDDSDVRTHLPIDSTGKVGLFTKLKDGLILCKLINLSVPNTIDERAINKGKLNTFLCHENLALALKSAAAIGCHTINVGVEDIVAGKPHLILGLLWQIIRIGLMIKVSLEVNPHLAVLLQEGEDISDLTRLSPEEILLRWVNYHMVKSGTSRRVKNFSSDINDGEVYSLLLVQIAPPEFCVSPIPLTDPSVVRQKLLLEADKINCRKFVRDEDIEKGNSKLNLAFVANLYNTHPGLDMGEEVEELEIEEVTRLDRFYMNWLNSLGVTPYVSHLYTELSSGVMLLQVLDKVQKGVVDWSKVNKAPFKIAGKMKKIENCNYAIELGTKMEFSLVGVGGEDFYNRNHTLTQTYLQQLMRAYQLSLLCKASGDTRMRQEHEVLNWVNYMLESCEKASRLTSFKDSTLASGVAIADLLDCIKPGCINYDLIETDNDQGRNARYAISVARKIGALVYTVSDDVVEVKTWPVTSLFISFMTVGVAMDS